jgi:hypothetical protein
MNEENAVSRIIGIADRAIDTLLEATKSLPPPLVLNDDVR